MNRLEVNGDIEPMQAIENHHRKGEFDDLGLGKVDLEILHERVVDCLGVEDEKLRESKRSLFSLCEV